MSSRKPSTPATRLELTIQATVTVCETAALTEAANEADAAAWERAALRAALDELAAGQQSDFYVVACEVLAGE